MIIKAGWSVDFSVDPVQYIQENGKQKALNANSEHEWKVRKFLG